MKNKGAAHLEMITAFGLFIVATTFLLVFLNPTKSNTLSESAVISLKDNFVKNSSTELVKAFVNNSCAPGKISKLNAKSIELEEGYYYILFSSEIEGELEECSTSVKIGSISRENVISNKSLGNMLDEYYSNYDVLKEQIGVPRSMDFEIYSTDGEFEMRKEDPKDIEIIAKKYLLKVIYSNGEIKNKDFIFRVW